LIDVGLEKGMAAKVNNGRGKTGLEEHRQQYSLHPKIKENILIQIL
jgi:hypothetical protein